MKDNFIQMGLSQMEGRIFGVKLHQKLTSIISIASNKGAKRQRKNYVNINKVNLRKGASKKKKPEPYNLLHFEISPAMGQAFWPGSRKQGYS